MELNLFRLAVFLLLVGFASSAWASDLEAIKTCPIHPPYPGCVSQGDCYCVDPYPWWHWLTGDYYYVVLGVEI